MASPLSMSAVDALASQLHGSAVDLVHAFRLSELSMPLPAALPALLEGAQTGLLVGNTRVIWPHFLSWLAAHPSWQTWDDPLDAYAEEVVSEAVDAHLPGARVLWTHETQAYVVPAQRLCHASGFAHLSKGHFNVHPTYGPWFALRALVVIPEDLRPPVRAAIDPSSPEVEARAARRLEQLCAQASDGLNSQHIRTTWVDWLALRDLYEIGRAHRYCADQVRYHYTKDKTVLERALAQHKGR